MVITAATAVWYSLLEYQCYRHIRVDRTEQTRLIQSYGWLGLVDVDIFEAYLDQYQPYQNLWQLERFLFRHLHRCLLDPRPS